MSESVTAQIEALRNMTVAELQRKHLELFGTETQSRHKGQLFKRLAWRIQELAYGGLSERAKHRAEEIADDLDARILPPKKPTIGGAGHREIVPARVQRSKMYPAPGTVLSRGYRGEVHQVTVLDQGIEYRGRVFRSLSGVARKITGTHWNGKLFFGLKKRVNGR